MSLFDFFSRKQSAPVARERLQIMLAHDRALSGNRDLAAILQEEILAVIAKHIAIDREKVLVKLDRGKAVSTLEIDIEMPGAPDVLSGKLADKPEIGKPKAVSG
jgi:cell division topological specificity factor